LVGRLDPNWVAFMNTLAQPFKPIVFQDREPWHPFTEPVGLRGDVVVFESQYRTVDAWDGGLLADLAFVTGVEWEECASGAASCEMHGFVCDLMTDSDPLTGRKVLTAIKAADFRSEHIAKLDVTQIPFPGYHPDTLNDEIHTDFAYQYLFDNETNDPEQSGTHRMLREYVSGSRLWYVLLHIGEKPCDVALLAVGRSPYGNRLVGAITNQMCHSLCD